MKLPPEMAVSSSARTIGLSVTAAASMVASRGVLKEIERSAHDWLAAVVGVRPGLTDMAGQDLAARAGRQLPRQRRSAGLAPSAEMRGRTAWRLSARRPTKRPRQWAAKTLTLNKASSQRGAGCAVDLLGLPWSELQRVEGKSIERRSGGHDLPATSIGRTHQCRGKRPRSPVQRCPATDEAWRRRRATATPRRRWPNSECPRRPSSLRRS